MGELDLELLLVLGHGHTAHGARRTDARTSPGTVRGSTGHLALADRGAGLLAQDRLVWHSAVPRRAHSPTASASNEREGKPDARGSDARCASRRPAGRRTQDRKGTGSSGISRTT